MQITNIENWKYGIDDDNKLFIEPPPEIKKPKPDVLYKYYTLNNYSLSVLEKLNIYASNPLSLNDPYDTSSSLIDFDNIDAIKTIFNPIISYPEIKNILETNPEKLKKDAQFQFLIQLYSKMGIFCLTENPHNMLMWAYYTNHQGFCIEFDYQSFPFDFHGPFQINYRESFTPISINKGGPVCVSYQSNIKSKVWEHESEWRLLPIKAGMSIDEYFYTKDVPNVQTRLFPINIENIKKIVLGHNFFDEVDEKHHIDQKNIRISMTRNIESRNRLINWIIENRIPCEIILSKINSFQLESIPIGFERESESVLNAVVDFNVA